MHLRQYQLHHMSPRILQPNVSLKQLLIDCYSIDMLWTTHLSKTIDEFQLDIRLCEVFDLFFTT